MTYNIQIIQVTPRPLAATRGMARRDNIGPKLIAMLSEVWEFIRTSGLAHAGLNVALYPGGDGCATLATDTEIPLEAAVEVLSTFQGEGRIICSASPGGWVATVAHIGPYDRLGEAHTAVRQWCSDNGHELAGTSWEVYGHWTDNVDELRTDVFYLLKEQVRETY